MKDSLDGTKWRLDSTGKYISTLEDRSIENTQIKTQREINEEKQAIQNLWVVWNDLRYTGSVPRRTWREEMGRRNNWRDNGWELSNLDDSGSSVKSKQKNTMKKHIH